MTDLRLRALTAALAVGLLVAARCASPGPAVEEGVSERTADSLVRDTPLIAACSTTTQRPLVRVGQGRPGFDKVFPLASPGRLALPRRAAAICALESPERSPEALGRRPGAPRGPPAT